MLATRRALCRLGADPCDALIWKLGSGEQDQDRRKPFGFQNSNNKPKPYSEAVLQIGVKKMNQVLFLECSESSFVRRGPRGILARPW